MSIHAVLFGSVGTLVETSDLQRRAFNRAFVAANLDWYWDAKTYAQLLAKSGGVKRIAAFAEDLGETVDAKAVHQMKVAFFKQFIASRGLKLRPGVRDMIDAAKSMGQLVGFVTSTGADQSQAMIDALGDQLSGDDFDYIGDATRVVNAKPSPDIYCDALDQLNVAAVNAIAIEDSPISALSALAAGIKTYGFAGQMHENSAFPDRVTPIKQLDPQIFTHNLMAAE